MKLTLLVLPLILLSTPTFAVDNEVEIHRLKAQKLIDAKDWSSAEPEAKAIVDANSQDSDGWLMYGIVEQRLQHDAEAAKAYRTYLGLNPPEDKAAAVRSRLAEVEIRADKDQKRTSVENEERYGSNSPGIFFTFSPVYHPSTSSVLNGTVSNNFQGGFQFNHLLIGGLYSTGTIPSLRAPTEGQPAPATFTTVGPATLKILETYIDYNIPVTDSFEKTGPFSLFIPVHMGIYFNSMNLNNSTRSFGNISGDFAAGVGVEWFNRTPFTIGVSGLFHYGLPFTGIEEDSQSQAIQTMAGDDVTGGNSCFEFRITLKYLFGYEKTAAEKAGAQ
jgi:hypothetical protein